MRALVTGAGGFIGHHLVNHLKSRGYWVRGVDLKYPEYSITQADEFLLMDLRSRVACYTATTGVDEVYHLAADMGGIGYITMYLATICRNNILMDTNMLESAAHNKVERYFYSSSACIYPQWLQKEADVTPLRELDAYPADAEPGYGWEKLWAEQLAWYHYVDLGLQTRVARFHNVYGPYGTFDGGKEKAPAAICRKVASTADGGAIGVWGDGQQTRSFMYVDDCVEGIWRIMQSDYPRPLNLGTDVLISVDDLVDIVCRIAGKTLTKVHDTTKPQGVRGRNSDNTQMRRVLGWEPMTTLEYGLTETYRWIAAQVS